MINPGAYVRLRSLARVAMCFGLLAAIFPIIMIPLALFGPAKVVRLRRLLTRTLIRVAGCRLEARGFLPEMGRTCIYVANHQSMFDALIVSALLWDFSVIAKKDLRRIPFFGPIVKSLGMIFIDRKNRKESQDSIRLSAEKIRGGVSVLIFPEGTRTRDGSIGPFKYGAFKLALDTKAPIVPFSISGSFEANPSGWLAYPGRLVANFGSPILHEEYGRMPIADIADLCKQRIAALAKENE